jgi:DMSO/TMAO reductase YedYZ molybdopterin-dependent catalytic subunit
LPCDELNNREDGVSTRRGITRRTFLATAATATGVGGAALAWRGCSSPETEDGRSIVAEKPLALSGSGTLLDTDFPDPFAGGQCIGYLPFQGEAGPFLRVQINSGGGHNSRKIMDLASLLMPGERITPYDHFYVRTEYPDLLDTQDNWTIAVHGAVKQAQELPLSQLQSLVEPRGSVLLECSGNARQHLRLGLLSVGDFEGIPIEKMISLAQPTSKAKAILISGFDNDSRLPPTDGPPYKTYSWPTCSWIFTFDQLIEAKAFLATRLNGDLLTRNLGRPMRLVVPGWFGCTGVKWVNEIKFVDNDQPATLQMLEFASRTFQKLRDDPSLAPVPVGPQMARDYLPAVIDQAATAVRVEQWSLGGKLGYRVVGITWGGGPHRTNKLKIRFVPQSGNAPPFEPVLFCAARTSNREYGIWCHRWQPESRGRYFIDLQLDAPGSPSRKMHTHDEHGIPCYAREVVVPEV